jgi:hypothetical protein
MPLIPGEANLGLDRLHALEQSGLDNGKDQKK